MVDLNQVKPSVAVVVDCCCCFVVVVVVVVFPFKETWVQHINTRQNKQTSLHVGLLKNHSLRVCSNVQKRLIPQTLLNRAYIIYLGKCAVK